jgi:hypothetical protein
LDICLGCCAGEKQQAPCHKAAKRPLLRRNTLPSRWSGWFFKKNEENAAALHNDPPAAGSDHLINAAISAMSMIISIS